MSPEVEQTPLTAEALQAEPVTKDEALQPEPVSPKDAGLQPAIKAAVAAQTDDPGFARVRPPFTQAGAAHEDAIAEAVRLAGPQTAR